MWQLTTHAHVVGHKLVVSGIVEQCGVGQTVGDSRFCSLAHAYLPKEKLFDLLEATEEYGIQNLKGSLWLNRNKMYGPSGQSWCYGLEFTRSIEGRKVSAIALQITRAVRQRPRKVCREVVVCSGVCRLCWCTQTVFTASEGVFGEKAGEGEECRRGSGTLEH